jgi:hypothetical protein
VGLAGTLGVVRQQRWDQAYGWLQAGVARGWLQGLLKQVCWPAGLSWVVGRRLDEVAWRHEGGVEAWQAHQARGLGQAQGATQGGRCLELLRCMRARHGQLCGLQGGQVQEVTAAVQETQILTAR